MYGHTRKMQFHIGEKLIELLLQRIRICDVKLTQDMQQKLERPQKFLGFFLQDTSIKMADIDCHKTCGKKNEK